MITKEMINAYIVSLEPGQLIDVKVKTMREDFTDGAKFKTLKAEVLEVLPFLVKTSRGYFRHHDVYFWNHGGYKGES